MLNWLIYICLGTGVILIVYSVFGFNTAQSKESGFDMEDAIRAMDRSINDADNTATELQKISQDVVTEIDEKYQQLLYLYSLIDEKSANIGAASKNIDISLGFEALHTLTKDEAKKKIKSKGLNPNLINDKYKAVFELYNKGITIPNIAKSLNIGQGEVKLVLELGKDR